MNDAQLALLAELTITNASTNASLVSLILDLVEDVRDLRPFEPPELGIVAKLEQLQATCEASLAAQEQARAYFGLPPAG